MKSTNPPYLIVFEVLQYSLEMPLINHVQIITCTQHQTPLVQGRRNKITFDDIKAKIEKMKDTSMKKHFSNIFLVELATTIHGGDYELQSLDDTLRKLVSHCTDRKISSKNLISSLQEMIDSSGKLVKSIMRTKNSSTNDTQSDESKGEQHPMIHLQANAKSRFKDLSPGV